MVLKWNNWKACLEYFSSINFENPLYFWRMRRKQKTVQENSENWGNQVFYILEWHIFWAEWVDACHGKWDNLINIQLHINTLRFAFSIWTKQVCCSGQFLVGLALNARFWGKPPVKRTEEKPEMAARQQEFDIKIVLFQKYKWLFIL